MLTIDLMLKNSPLPISVQRKDTEGAQATYQKIIESMKSSMPELIELSCEKDENKTIAVFSDQISAVIISEKSGSTTTGKGAGFFATVGE
jgi:hypothetical protein